jgi:L-iditol 2-dehydrogenase
MIDGAFAEYLCIRPEVCHKLPDSVSFKAAAMGEPLAVAVRATIERTQVHSGDRVVVSGPGCVGLLTLMVAKLEGAQVLIAGLAKDQLRLDCAAGLGADRIVNLAEESLTEVVAEWAGGAGADLVYECAGSEASLNGCLDVVRKEGTVVQVGVYPGAVTSELNRVMMKELRLIGTYGYVWTSWNRAVKLLGDGRLDLEPLVSHEFDLADYEEAFRVTQDDSAIKVVLYP